MTASARMRSREAAENGAKHRVDIGFHEGEMGQSFPGWPGMGGNMWSDLWANSGIGGVFFFFSVVQVLAILPQGWNWQLRPVGKCRCYASPSLGKELTGSP